VTGIGKAVLIPPGKGREFRIGGDRFRTKGGRSQRSEAFSVIEYEGAPGVPGPPVHVHRSFEEAWFLLHGTVNFLLDGKTVQAVPGTYLLVPRGVSHSFEVRGSKPARWLGIFSPGRYVGLVEELASAIPRHGPPNPKEIVELFARYDTSLVGRAGV
jgi:quercetin dioxygenase-like cupin family protein